MGRRARMGRHSPDTLPVVVIGQRLADHLDHPSAGIEHPTISRLENPVRIDTVIENARITTVDPDRPHATRIGILGGRVVGFDEDVPAGTVEAGGHFPPPTEWPT
mgnify:CR=1 FL=1